MTNETGSSLRGVAPREPRPPSVPLGGVPLVERHSSPAARMRWTDESGSSEVEIDGRRGLLVVPADSHGEERATLLLEALDRAAAGGRRRVQISRRGVTLELECTASWPAASRLPSVVLGEGCRFATPGAARRGGAEIATDLGERLERLGPEAVALIRDYPTDRRRAAAERRRVEARLVRFDDLVRGRRRIGRTALAAAGIAVATAVVGAAAGLPLILLAGAGSFFLLAAAVAWEKATRHAIESGRGSLEIELGRRADAEDHLDREARGIARQIGYADPWEASARVRKFEPREADEVRLTEDRETLVPLARRLLRAAGQSEDGIDWEVARTTSRAAGPAGWPAEASSGCESLFSAENALGAASLIRRANRLLDPRWPLVFYDPWPDHDAHDRARLLLAVSEVSRPRPVIAIIEPVTR
jgi:hypothetical protein